MTTSDSIQARTLVSLATQLQRLDRGSDPLQPDQYRDLIERIKAELTAVQPGAVLDTVLASFPSTAELYENLNYRHAGLCRSNLDAASRSEMQARKVIAAARNGKKA